MLQEDTLRAAQIWTLLTRSRRTYNYEQFRAKRIQVSMLAPTIYPFTSKLILMNFPCERVELRNETLVG